MSGTRPGLTYFVAYVRDRETRFQGTPTQGHRIAGIATAIGGTLVLGLGIPNFDSTLLSLGAVILGTGVAIWVTGRNRQPERPPPLLFDNVQELLSELRWMEKEKSLDARCHPRAATLLDACAKARAHALRSLSSQKWKDRAKDSRWDELRHGAIDSIESAMIDAVWAARHLVRRKGWRQSTFESRCADPEYGKFAFARLELIKSELEDLANHVSDEIYTHPLEQSAIRSVLADLRMVHEAKEELDRDVPSMLEE